MIVPALQDEAFLASVAAGGAGEDQFRLWWLGQSGFLIQWRKRHLLLDPYLSDSLTEKYAGTDKPHVRMTARVIAPDRLDFIDVVTSSHNHTDHLDIATLIPVLRVNPGVKVVVAEANRAFAAGRLSIPPDRLTVVDAGQSISVGEFRLNAIPAAHETLERDEHGHCRYVGYVVEFGPWAIYHSGDTVRYPEMVESLSRWRLNLMLLPINGRSPERRVAGNLDGAEAATLAYEVGAKLVIPCHYEMFTFNTASPELFRTTAKRLGQRYRVLRAGECWASDELGAASSAN